MYPLPEQWVLKLPFAFHVPIALPPTCHYKTAHKAKGTVSYWIKAVGVRPGLRWNKRITQTITLLPCNIRGAELSHMLEHGWGGEWAFRQFTKDVRRGVIGEHSRVTLTVSHCSWIRFHQSHMPSACVTSRRVVSHLHTDSFHAHRNLVFEVNAVRP